MFYKIQINSWDEIKSISKNSFHFIFRGHNQKDWKLKPTLERAADKFLMEYSHLPSNEYLIYRSFKSIANHYLKNIPDEKNYIEWMSILQHYGAPTRLLDFTYSLYIAAFFAFEFATDDCAIWGLNFYKLNDVLLAKMMADKKWKMRNLVLHDYNISIANKLFDFETEEDLHEIQRKYLDGKKIIFSVSPDNKNERIEIQNGVFLMPSDIEESFEKILIQQYELGIDDLSDDNAESINIDDFIKTKLNYNTCLFKLIIPRKTCLEGLVDLRNMNINAATLFPGLEGQARSLNMIMRSMEDVYLEIKGKNNSPLL
jgi:hypothetical protein